MLIIRTKKEIDEMKDKMFEGLTGGSKFPGMSYEEGIDAVLRWLTGETDEHPFEE